jgi:hypothetical protein
VSHIKIFAEQKNIKTKVPGCAPAGRIEDAELNDETSKCDNSEAN